MEKTIEYLKNNVKHYRTKLGLSQQKLAEECKVSTYYISGIERGHNYPSLKILIKISEVLNIPVYMLLIDPDRHQNDILEKFSKDLEDNIKMVITDLKTRY
ncbi:MAG: hypothetical protein B6229_08545 [Spirochaetaceae bacterium 4572_7]|nr:MAG: hypothetical protein B6229_08545 [Spirochaetaceae bacterium 4572_7]